MKKMEFSKLCGCCWALRFEILGVILLIIATLLTIVTLNSWGIVALFAAGVVLCLFNKACCYICPPKDSSCPVCDTPHGEQVDESAKKGKKSTAANKEK